MEDDFQFVDINAQINEDELDSDYNDDNSECNTENDKNDKNDRKENENENGMKRNNIYFNNNNINNLQKELSQQLSELKLERQKNDKEYCQLQMLKKDLNNKISSVDTLIRNHKNAMKNLKDEASKYAKMRDEMKQQVLSLNDLRKSVMTQKNELNNKCGEFNKNCNELSNILSALSIVPDYIEKNKEINKKLNAFYNDTNEMEKEVTKLKELRQKQEDLIKQAKIDLETMRSDHIANCLKEFDASVAYSCKECDTHIAIEGEIESRCYQVGQGTFSEKKRGYLFKDAANLELGPTKTENFTTGSYKISWVTCVKCHQSMGWKYLSADNPNNCSKVGKYCLARYSLHSPQERNNNNNSSNANASSNTSN